MWMKVQGRTDNVNVGVSLQTVLSTDLPVVMIVGNKNDCSSDRMVSHEEGQSLALVGWVSMSTVLPHPFCVQSLSIGNQDALL